MIGLGICTYNRPTMFAALAASVRDHLPDVDVYVVNDGGDPEPLAPAIEALAPRWVHHAAANQGVATAKNMLLRRLLAAGCEWLFLAEDDIVVRSSRAIDGYVEACEASGYEHLTFHAHGPANPEPLFVRGAVTLWPNYVGAWSIYSRACLEDVGLFDEAFTNAWEHVEHTLRLGERGWTAPWRGAADATGSEAWLAEQPGAIQHSVIRPRDDWAENIAAGRAHWKAAHPETYRKVFGG